MRSPGKLLIACKRETELVQTIMSKTARPQLPLEPIFHRDYQLNIIDVVIPNKREGQVDMNNTALVCAT